MKDLLNRQIVMYVALGLVGLSAIAGQQIVTQEALERCHGPGYSEHCESLLNSYYQNHFE